MVAGWRTPPELSDDIRQLSDTEPGVQLSAVTPWEAAIKQSLGKLKGPEDLPERARGARFTPLPVTAAHGVRAGRLPPHRDPFDRLLIAQAQCEDLTLVTRDAWIPRYDVHTLSV